MTGVNTVKVVPRRPCCTPESSPAAVDVGVGVGVASGDGDAVGVAEGTTEIDGVTEGATTAFAPGCPHAASKIRKVKPRTGVR
ncbi:MAG: hypothetical protein JWN96_1186 [Mycobacterium sp.]|nr:hypothetical protein [Mycobacterium sp.]